MLGNSKPASQKVGKVNNEGATYSVAETSWGYVIGSGQTAALAASIGEIAAVIGAIAFGAMAYLQWLLPGAMNEPDLLPFKAVGTIIFFMFSAMLYLMARNGLLREIHVDFKNRTVSIVRRNRESVGTVEKEYRFDQIRRVYLARSKTGNRIARMYIEPKTGPAIMVARGPNAEMQPLLELVMDGMKTGITIKRVTLREERVAVFDRLEEAFDRRAAANAAH
ncbi:MAG: hypothetical protein OEZ19_09570 [Paracoccaceae bacterium]|nr:hypothetical protein [Paracoccaceae bacterium]